VFRIHVEMVVVVDRTLQQITMYVNVLSILLVIIVKQVSDLQV
jgi:hypothetical protein